MQNTRMNALYIQMYICDSHVDSLFIRHLHGMQIVGNATLLRHNSKCMGWCVNLTRRILT